MGGGLKYLQCDEKFVKTNNLKGTILCRKMTEPLYTKYCSPASVFLGD